MHKSFALLLSLLLVTALLSPAALADSLPEDDFFILPEEPVFTDGAYEAYIVSWEAPENAYQYLVGLMAETIYKGSLFLYSLTPGFVGDAYVSLGDGTFVFVEGRVPYDSITLEADETSLDVAEYINKSIEDGSGQVSLFIAIAPMEGKVEQKSIALPMEEALAYMEAAQDAK